MTLRDSSLEEVNFRTRVQGPTAQQDPESSKRTAWISYQETAFYDPESTTYRRNETNVADEKLGINHESVEPLAAILMLRDLSVILGPRCRLVLRLEYSISCWAVLWFILLIFPP